MKEKILPNHNKTDIEMGIYKDCYVVYNRKSTDEPENQKNSLIYQQSENMRFAQKELLRIAPVTIPGFCTNGSIAEKHSAFKEDQDMIISDTGMVQFKVERPKFRKLIQLLNQRLFKGVIFLCWDRASRNDADEAILKKLLKSGVELRFTLTSYDKSSSGALHMDIDGMFAQHHSRVTSEKVKLNTKNQREKGICTYGAPIGYLNTGTMKHKPLDPVRSPIIKQLFELYATGDWTLSKLTEWAINQGLTMTPIRRKRTAEEMQREEEQDTLVIIEPIARIPYKQGIHRILANPFYMGKIYGVNGELVNSISHTSLISEELFNKVQKQLAKKNISSKYSISKDYPYRGLIRCAECLRVYTPYVKKGIQYFCVNCKEGCINQVKNINLEHISKLITSELERIVFSEKEINEINTKIVNEATNIKTQQKLQKDQFEREKKKLLEEMTYLSTNKLTLLKSGVYSPEEFKKESEVLREKLIVLGQQESSSLMINTHILKQFVKLSELLKDLMLYDFIAKVDEKDRIARIVFSELFYSQKGFRYQCKNGFEALEKRLVTSCAPNESFYELPYLSEVISKDIEMLDSVLDYIRNSI